MPSSTLEQAIQAKLKATGAITTYTSAIYWISAPDGVSLPYITYRVIAMFNEGEQIGANKDSTATVQFDVFSDNQYEALNISNALISTIEAFSGGFDGKNITRVTTTGPTQLRDLEFQNIFRFVIDADMTFYR